MNKHVSSDGHQMSLAGGGVGGPGVIQRRGGLYSEVQCIMDNSHMGPPSWTDKQTDTYEKLPSDNFVVGA